MKISLLWISFLVLFFDVGHLRAQHTWTPVDIAPHASVNSLVFGLDSTPYVGCLQGGAYYYDDAEQWEYLSSDLDNEQMLSFLVHSGGTFFSSSNAGLLVSRNEGITWDLETEGLPEEDGIFVLAEAPGGDIYAGAGTKGMYISRDEGNTWLQADIPDSLAVFDITVDSDSAYFVITSHRRFYRSLDSGDTWMRFDVDIDNPYPYQIGWLDSTLIMSSDRLYYSPDLGETWDLFENSPEGSGSYELLILDTVIFAGIGRGALMRSMDRGMSWDTVGNHLPETSNWTLKAFDGVIYAGINKGIYRSPDLGDSWEPMNEGLRNMHINGVLQLEDGTQFTHTLEDLYRREEGGDWSVVNPNRAQITDISSDSDGIYVATLDGLFYSEDASNWVEIEVAYPELPADSSGIPEPFAAFLVHHERMMFLASNGRGIQLSRDMGETWEEINQGIPSVFALTCSDLVIGKDGDLYASFLRMPQVFMAIDAGSSWTPLPVNPFEGTTFALTISGSGDIYAGGVEGVARSTDQGNSWTRVLEGPFVRDLMVADDVLIAGTRDGLYFSTDGLEWEKDIEFPGDYDVQTLFEAPDGSIYAGTRGYGLFKISSFLTTNNDRLSDNLEFNPNLVPNPASDYFEVRFSDPLERDVQLNLMDVTGRVISRKLVGKGAESFQMQVGELPGGLYYLNFNAGDRFLTRKIILW